MDSEDEGSASNSEDDLLERGFFFLDEDPDAEDVDDDSDASDLDEESLGEELQELKTEAEIRHFSAVLAEAQAMAVKAEREATEGKRKRPRHYTGNSIRTKRYHALKRHQLGLTG